MDDQLGNDLHVDDPDRFACLIGDCQRAFDTSAATSGVDVNGDLDIGDPRLRTGFQMFVFTFVFGRLELALVSRLKVLRTLVLK